MKKLGNLNQASDKDLLQFILSSQLLILRRLDFIEDKINKLNPNWNSNYDNLEYEKSLKEFINKIDVNLERINQELDVNFKASNE